MSFSDAMGIDVSKSTIDVFLYHRSRHAVFNNNQSGMLALKKWLKELNIDHSHLLTCLEHTGLYSFGLTQFFEAQDWPYVLESGLQIKRSMGITRGKNDKVDAQQIARYAYLRRSELQPERPVSGNMHQIERLLSMRQRLVGQRSGFKVSLKEQSRVLDKADYNVLLNVQQQMIDTLNAQISILDKRIQILTQQDSTLQELLDLITSVKGIGPIIGLHLIVVTKGFSRFSNSRKFASYCGVAPFEYRSGTSIRGRTRVSPYANKNIKALLNMAALSAIQSDPELRKYYKRRIADGKNKMATLNIVRNKLIGRVFAVVKRRTPFVEVYSRAA